MAAGAAVRVPRSRPSGQASARPVTTARYSRTGLWKALFAVARPADAGACALTGDTLALAGPLGARRISVADIDAVDVRRLWGRSGVRIGTAERTAEVSGLARREAAGLADALRRARLGSWLRALSTHAPAVRSADARLRALSRPDSYVRLRAFVALLEDVRAAESALPGRWPDWAPRTPELDALERARALLADPAGARARMNEAYLAHELGHRRAFLDQVEARPLTGEQRRAVCVDDDRNLVVAAAGSGKTSVMVAKAGWLVERGDRRPDELLLLAFARAARDELAERVRTRLGAAAAADTAVRTFHALGLAIIGEAEGRRPTLAATAQDDAAMLDLVGEIVDGLLGHARHGPALVRWLAYGAAPYRAAHEFSSQGEYWDYVRNHEIRSLQGELVKSCEECLIANFVYLNGVPYEYERPYEHDTATAARAQYRPDFHLTDAGIYIEHFALGEGDRTPPFIDREKYLADRRWKLALHKERGTTLVETFSRDQAEGDLVGRLRARLEAEGVRFEPIPHDDVFAVLNEQGRVAPFVRLATTFLQHFKGSRLSLDAVRRRAARMPARARAEAFLRVFAPIFERYQRTLADAGEIDFHDMVNRATDHVAAGRYRSPYGYILVDEFQDISPGRAALVKALLDQSPDAQLFAVGDDWQAIYRFAGSDVAVMREFGERFGAGARTDLETTFRCSGGVAAVATRFVLANPAQIPKSVRAVHDVDGAGVWLGLGGEDAPALLDDALARVAAETRAEDGRPSVLLLGRYRHARPDLRRLAARHPSLEISYRTVHAAKGLEADYVVVLGLGGGRYGFPSEMADDPLLNLVLSEPEAHPNAEERRLLYVALTRARRRAYLLEDGGPRSAFAEELLKAPGIAEFGRRSAADAACPDCGTGRLVRRRGPGESVFYGCSNYPYCERTERACPACADARPVADGNGAARCPACGHAVESCPRCDGWLTERTGRHGPFLGCTNYPHCRFTKDARSGAEAVPGRHRPGDG